MVGVPVDAEGLVTDALPDDARLVYVTPAHQFPLGVAMSLRRRLALLAWAERTGAAIVEDDYDSEYRYGGRPLEPLHGLDHTGRVLYVGSFSKVLLPTLRLGFVVAPPPLHDALRKAKHLTDWHTQVPLQAAAARFVADGHLARHIRRMRAVYAPRHQMIQAALTGPLAAHLRVIPSAAGLHVAALLRTGGDDTAVVTRALARDVALQPLSHFRIGTDGPQGLVLGYGAIPTEHIDEGLRRLACTMPAERQAAEGPPGRPSSGGRRRSRAATSSSRMPNTRSRSSSWLSQTCRATVSSSIVRRSWPISFRTAAILLQADRCE